MAKPCSHSGGVQPVQPLRLSWPLSGEAGAAGVCPHGWVGRSVGAEETVRGEGWQDSGSHQQWDEVRRGRRCRTLSPEGPLVMGQRGSRLLRDRECHQWASWRMGSTLGWPGRQVGPEGLGGHLGTMGSALVAQWAGMAPGTLGRLGAATPSERSWDQAGDEVASSAEDTDVRSRVGPLEWGDWMGGGEEAIVGGQRAGVQLRAGLGPGDAGLKGREPGVGLTGPFRSGGRSRCSVEWPRAGKVALGRLRGVAWCRVPWLWGCGCLLARAVSVGKQVSG